MAEIRKIVVEPKAAAGHAGGKLKVAAYCRVSTDTEEQKTSFEAQVESYTARNPHYQLST